MNLFHIDKKFTEHLFIVGVLGGVASGKSTVCQILGQYGAVVINTDEISHQVLDYPEVQEKIIHEWGNSILENNKIDRKKLGSIVFTRDNQTKNENLTKLENIIHPYIQKELEKILQHLAPNTIVLFDVALLWEVGLHKICNVLLFIETTSEVRANRGTSIRGWSEDEVATREKYQKDLDSKKAIANFIIHNNGNMDDLKVQLKEIWQKINCQSNKTVMQEAT